MKYLASIFIIFVLALSIWPCCDDEANFSTEQDHVSQVQERPCSSNESPHTCSPFFHCSSCQAFALTPPLCTASSVIVFKKAVSYAELPTSPIVLFPGDIWQPPQLL